MIDNLFLGSSNSNKKKEIESIFEKNNIVHTPYNTENKELVYACQSVMLTVANKVYLESIIKQTKNS